MINLSYHIMKRIPLHSLVLIVGPANSGKTTVASSKFKPYEIISLNSIKSLLVGDTTRQDINIAIWNTLKDMVRAKLKIGERVVVDASNIFKNERIETTSIALELGIPIFYVIVDRPLQDKLKDFNNPNIVNNQHSSFLQNLKDIVRGDGIAEVIDNRTNDFHVVHKIDRINLINDIKNRGYNGISIVGDIHGQYESAYAAIDWAKRRNNFLLFLGDVIDYGPRNVDTINLIYDCVTKGQGVNIIGNHELKISKWFSQRKDNLYIRISDGNRVTIDEIESQPESIQVRIESKFNTLMNLGSSHWSFDNFVFAHGGVSNGMERIYKQKLTGKLAKFAMFGELDDSAPFDSEGVPNRTYHWVEDIRPGLTAIVGHDILNTSHPMIMDNKQGGKTIFLDTGSGKGGYLSVADIPFSEMKVTNFYRC